jgi:UDP-N-acetylglucosamine:LPS N-acetylglucosamine transferase
MDDCIFISRDPLPRGINNLHILDQRFRYPDLIASSDLVCTKAGYSTLATAFAHDKPVISCSRENFYEFKAMESFMQENEVGIIMEPEKFYSCRWQEYIKKARKLTVKGKVKLQGELEVLEIIQKIL